MSSSDTGGHDRRIQPIPVLRYSTHDLPPEERYRAWYLRDWPRTEPIYRTEPTEPFNTRWESVQLGDLIFVHAEITGMRWERRAQDVRVSDFDPIIVNMMIEGEAQGDMDGRPFREGPGMFHFHDLGRPSLHASTGSRTWSLVLPRPVAERRFAPLHDLHGLVVGGTGAAALFAFAAHVHETLPRLDLSESERLGQVFLDLLSVALIGARTEAPVRLSKGEVLRRRAVEEIERRLGGEVNIADLQRAVGVSRNRLFALFQADGGVQAFVMSQRLERARVALAELYRGETISNIALRLGFGDSSHLSRTFRKRYGMTPRDYRKLLENGPTEVAAGG
jgi:AraC-like DNA-binding protein